jgi:hypothetical protein
MAVNSAAPGNPSMSDLPVCLTKLQRQDQQEDKKRSASDQIELPSSEERPSSHVNSDDLFDQCTAIFRVPLWRAVELLVQAGVAEDGLHVFSGLGEGDGFYELLGVAVFALRQPFVDSLRTSVVGG